MSTAAVIVAAGRGTRAGGSIPKQWQTLGGRRVADWTFEAFAKSPDIDRIVLVLHPDDIDDGLWPAGSRPDIVAGGETRSASVMAGLLALEGSGITNVLIHDVARPCVSTALISRVVEALDNHPGVAPALEVTDALWHGVGNIVTGVQDRRGLYRAQTPQGFHYNDILAAHRAYSGTAADDVEVARAAGMAVYIVEGDEANLKITLPGDFARAERYLRDTMDIRLGNGFDVHRFAPGTAVVLCGIEVPHTHALEGHSDADVGMHAVTDAIYGALAEGDIGQHFPPSDPRWKDAASEVFLRHAVDLAGSRGYQITNTDCTLICERPKIGPYSAPMRAEMARLMGIEANQVSVKATTSERLGFTGREEGIAALATVTLVRP